MADLFGGTGGGSGGGASGLGGGTSGQYGPLSSQTYYADPEAAQRLIQALSRPAQQAAGQYMNFLNDPTASPLFQNQLSGIMNNPVMQNARQQQTQGLEDAFRGAGNMSSSLYGGARANQNTQFLQQDQTMASQLLGQMFPQIMQALQFPMGQADNLLNAMRLQQSYRAPQPQQTISSGGSGMSGGSSSRPSTGGNINYSDSYGSQPTQQDTYQDPWAVGGYGPNGDMTLGQANDYYGNMGSTWLGADGGYVTGDSSWLNEGGGGYQAYSDDYSNAIAPQYDYSLPSEDGFY